MAYVTNPSQNFIERELKLSASSTISRTLGRALSVEIVNHDVSEAK
jgi:hypothetical protein